jgi:hypothetical protein
VVLAREQLSVDGFEARPHDDETGCNDGNAHLNSRSCHGIDDGD